MRSIFNLWNVWLRRNNLNNEKAGKYIAQVVTDSRAKNNEDIANQIIAEGSELKYETILSVLNRGERIIREYVQKGHKVHTQNCRFIPKVTGVWESRSTIFDEAQHKVTLDIIPAAKMKAALDDINIKVLSVKENGAHISVVTDIATGSTSGLMTSGDFINIQGSKIRVAPEDDAETGVFFVDSSGNAIPVTRRYTMNDPKRLIVRVPQLDAGEYTLRIVTRYCNGVVLLKEPRIVESELLFEVR